MLSNAYDPPRSDPIGVTHLHNDWVLNNGPFIWKALANPYADDLTHVVVTKDDWHYQWFYSAEQAAAHAEALNERMALLLMTEGTPAYKLVQHESYKRQDRG